MLDFREDISYVRSTFLHILSPSTEFQLPDQHLPAIHPPTTKWPASSILRPLMSQPVHWEAVRFLVWSYGIDMLSMETNQERSLFIHLKIQVGFKNVRISYKISCSIQNSPWNLAARVSFFPWNMSFFIFSSRMTIGKPTAIDDARLQSA